MTRPYRGNSQKWGGRAADYPHLDFENGPRQYDREKRPVKVTLSTYGGIVPGAFHWFARAREADSLLRDDTDRCWRKVWGDTVGSGREFERGGTNRARLVRWLAAIIRRHFGPETHVLGDCEYVEDEGDCVDAGEECATCEVRRLIERRTR